MQFTVQVEKVSNISRKLTVKVSPETVKKTIEKGYAQVQRTAKLKGFRPGMVPLPVIKQHYGPDVQHQAFHDLINDSYREVLRTENIKAIGAPQIETPQHQTGQGAHDHAIREGDELTYTATVEILPEIEVKGHTGLSLTRGKVQIQEADVQKAIESMLSAQAELVPATGGLVGADGKSSREVKKGDFVDLSFSGGLVTETGVEEKPGMKGSRVLEVGSDALIPGFEDNLIGMRAGETKTFRVPFPKDFYDAEMAGKDAEFTCTVSEVKEKKMPELNDEFAKGAGYENVADLREKARGHLTQEREQEVERKLKSDILNLLVEKNPFDVPQSLIQAQTRQLAQEVAQNLKQQGFNDQMVQEALTSELENLKKRAESQVRASLILEAVAKKEGFSVTPAELDEELKKMAVSMQVEEAKVRDFYQQNPGRMDDLEFRLREDRTIKFIIDKAKVKEEK